MLDDTAHPERVQRGAVLAGVPVQRMPRFLGALAGAGQPRDADSAQGFPAQGPLSELRGLLSSAFEKQPDESAAPQKTGEALERALEILQGRIHGWLGPDGRAGSSAPDQVRALIETMRAHHQEYAKHIPSKRLRSMIQPPESEEGAAAPSRWDRLGAKLGASVSDGDERGEQAGADSRGSMHAVQARLMSRIRGHALVKSLLDQMPEDSPQAKVRAFGAKRLRGVREGIMARLHHEDA